MWLYLMRASRGRGCSGPAPPPRKIKIPLNYITKLPKICLRSPWQTQITVAPSLPGKFSGSVHVSDS